MTASSDPLVRCEQLVIGFGRRPLLPPIDLSIERGEVMLVVGHNGAGKTTLARTILGLLRPLGGAAHRRAGPRCTYVPQATAIDALVPLQVDELVRWGAQRGWSFLEPWARRRAAAPAGESAAVPEILGIAELRRRRFGELSGGQRQRVLLARLLAGDAELAVLDEPTASMDGPTAAATFAALRRLAAERGTTSLVISHAAAIAAPHVDRIALLDPEGAGVLVGPPGEVAASPRFRGLFGAVTLAATSATTPEAAGA
jgi:zinc transport system ATP-binding protein